MYYTKEQILKEIDRGPSPPMIRKVERMGSKLGRITGNILGIIAVFVGAFLTLQGAWIVLNMGWDFLVWLVGYAVQHSLL